MYRQLGDQYRAQRDAHGTWRIVDLWNSDLNAIDPEDELDDNHPAITVISEGEFIALLDEAVKIGVVENAVVGVSSQEQTETILETVMI